MANRRTHCLVEANKHGSTLLVDPAGEKNRCFYQCLASFILVRRAKRATALVSRRLGASPLDARTRMHSPHPALNLKKKRDCSHSTQQNWLYHISTVYCSQFLLL